MWGKSETRGREGGPRLSTRKRSVEESVDTSVAKRSVAKRSVSSTPQASVSASRCGHLLESSHEGFFE